MEKEIKRDYYLDYDCGKQQGKPVKKQLEVDFICNKGSKKYYIQTAYMIGTAEKTDLRADYFEKQSALCVCIIAYRFSCMPQYDRHLSAYFFEQFPACVFALVTETIAQDAEDAPQTEPCVVDSAKIVEVVAGAVRLGDVDIEGL